MINLWLRKYLSCMGYPTCKTAVWFPDTVLEVSRDDTICPTCQPHPVNMLNFKFKRGSLPPGMPLEFVGCIGGCDETLREVLNLKYLRGGGAGAGARGDSGIQVNQVSVPRESNPSRTNTGLQSGPDSRPPPPRPRADSSRPPPPSFTPAWSIQPPTSASSKDNSVVCNCGQDALLLTVRKEGPNQGRQFYKCSVGNCNFFLWADQSNDQLRPTRSRELAVHNAPPRPSTGFVNIPQWRVDSTGSGGGGEDCMCNCNEPAITRTVMKDGPNKGRMFLTCAKPRDQQCGFFQWMNENVAPAGSESRARDNSKWTGNKKTGASSTKAPATKKPRTCGICHQPGHTRVKCPQGQ